MDVSKSYNAANSTQQKLMTMQSRHIHFNMMCLKQISQPHWNQQLPNHDSLQHPILTDFRGALLCLEEG
jgi:hypothetical protein